MSRIIGKKLTISQLTSKMVSQQPFYFNAFFLKAHYCVMNTPMRTPLPLALAFRRFFQVLAAGILLPNSPALVDPCDSPARIHFSLSLDEMVIKGENSK